MDKNCLPWEDRLIWLGVGALGSVVVLPFLYARILKNTVESVFLKNVVYCFGVFLISLSAYCLKSYLLA